MLTSVAMDRAARQAQIMNLPQGLDPAIENMGSKRTIFAESVFVLLPFVLVLLTTIYSTGQQSSDASQEKSVRLERKLELSRPVRPWEFISSMGTRAALFGNESGQLEAWVYPLKIVRDFHLRFRTQGLVLPAESLARTLRVRPESTSILYATDTFTVRETLFAPVHEAGAIIQLEIDAAEPVEVEAEFQRDFQLEWPAAIAGGNSYWDTNLRAFVFTDELNRFKGLIGSPTAERSSEEYWTNYSSAQQDSFRLGVTNKGHDTKMIVISGSWSDVVEKEAAMKNAAEKSATAADLTANSAASSTANTTTNSTANNGGDAEATYRRLSSASNYEKLLAESSDYYREYLARTVNLSLPDQQLQAAYDWSRISTIQGLVENPFLGASLIAGYGGSGDSLRPGFAWFFGRDALWTSLALDSDGDFASTRNALDFLEKYQRDDGKIPHEISQSASMLPWFKDYPFPYASADATPLFIVVMDDYVTHSGDVEYAKKNWTSLWKAYEFLRSTYDTLGLPQNAGVGHGWIEGGPLLPVNTELYQSGLGAEALRSLSHIALLIGKKDVSEDLAKQFEKQQSLVNSTFWSPEKNAFVYALDKDDRRLDTISVLAAVPMWFGLLDGSKAEATIDQLASPDHQTDWGMRIISSRNPSYNPGGYHFGSVWPLFTGWAATAEYRYHRAFPAYANLRSNALLSFDGSLGHVTEVLSGDFYQPSPGSSPQQIWSAAMITNPLLRGLLGLNVDAVNHNLTFSPHVPSDWTTFRVGNLRVGSTVLDLDYARTPDSIALNVRRTGSEACSIEFSPAVSLRAQVLGAEINGRPVKFRVVENSEDQHAQITIPFAASTVESKLRIRLRNDFGLSIAQNLPPLGARSQGLRIVSESWTPMRDALTLQLAGEAGGDYELKMWNAAQVASLDGAEMAKDAAGTAIARIKFDAKENTRQIVFHLRRGK